MCGIIGYFGEENASSLVLEGLKIMRARGRDAAGLFDGKSLQIAKEIGQLKLASSQNAIGHLLHAMVNHIPQPLIEDGAALIANCEIYNWKELSEKYSLRPKNDAHLLLLLINKIGIEEALRSLRGVYAFCYWKEDQITLARDTIGIKPLWYSNKDGLCFSSEKKALKTSAEDIIELNPRTLLHYDLKTKKTREIKREFFRIPKEIAHSDLPSEADEKRCLEKIKTILADSVRIRIPDSKFGVLFSGGIDSVIIAKLLRDLGCDFTCYVAGISEKDPDVLAAQEASDLLGLSLKKILIGKKNVEDYLSRLVPLIEDSNVIKVGVALPLFAACEQASKEGVRVLFSGGGADELFGGYHRYKSQATAHDLNKDCYSDILKIYEKNCYRDDVITMNNTIELRVPFLDASLVGFALTIPPSLKIKETKGEKIEKYILRECAKSIGIPKQLAFRKKKAAQYGSGADKAIEKIASSKKLTKSAYLDSFYQKKNLKLGILLSSGKDSLFAAYTMKKQNYDLACAITLTSKNPDSFMFHTPNTHLAALQAEAMGIPIIEQITKGEKEEELSDLKDALRKAKELHRIEGVVSGALFSNYQRERIEKAADECGLKLFSPLWHMDQEQEVRNLLRDGFEIILVKVAAEGLDSSWLGRPITQKDVDELVKLHKKYKINIAGEGGEYESLVLDCPLFNKKINILKKESIVQKDSAWLIIKSVELIIK